MWSPHFLTVGIFVQTGVLTAIGWDWAKKLSRYPGYKNASATDNKVLARYFCCRTWGQFPLFSCSS